MAASFLLCSACMAEQWKDVPEFPGYRVSNLGRVQGVSGRVLRPCITSNGYVQYIFCREDGKYPKRGHRLVAEAFIPNPLSLPIVHHINHERQDNRAENLMWCTCSQNLRFAVEEGRPVGGSRYPRKSFESCVEAVLHVLRGATQSEAAKRTGVEASYISRLVRGLCRRNVLAEAKRRL